MAAPVVSSSITSLGEVLQSLYDNLNALREQLKGNAVANKSIDFNKEEYWETLNGASNLISHEATKLCILFNKPPLPSIEECQAVAKNMESSCVALLAHYFKLPPVAGQMLNKEVYIFIINIIDAVKDLCIEAKEQRSASQLQSVGNVWEKCNNIKKLPKDNTEAALIVLKSQLLTVQDALNELEQSIENEGQNAFELEELTPVNGFPIHHQQSWSEQDREMVIVSSGLVKTAKACLKKINIAVNTRGSSSTIETIAELDSIASSAASVSEFIDDFVLSLYPPIVQDTVKQHAITLKDHLLKMLDEFCQSHCCHDEDKSWVDFLCKAVHHNFSKVNNILTED